MTNFNTNVHWNLPNGRVENHGVFCERRVGKSIPILFSNMEFYYILTIPRRVFPLFAFMGTLRFIPD